MKEQNNRLIAEAAISKLRIIELTAMVYASDRILDAVHTKSGAFRRAIDRYRAAKIGIGEDK